MCQPARDSCSDIDTIIINPMVLPKSSTDNSPQLCDSFMISRNSNNKKIVVGAKVSHTEHALVNVNYSFKTCGHPKP